MSGDDAIQLEFPIGHGSLRYVGFFMAYHRTTGWTVGITHAHEGELSPCHPAATHVDLTLTEAIDLIITTLSHANGGYKEINGACVPR